MEDFKVLNIGKFFFWLSFTLGSICLLGFIITDNTFFVISGYLLLIYGSVANLMVFLGLIVYGLVNRKHRKASIKSALIILINVPIAFLYAWIGIEIL